ncbi:protein kinase [Paenibacillus sp. UNC499MF]|uniref:serine/threonine protein kinase n=1 Tax=Paenibacillus sp. UNC499MF TaxID=1502751 RepID=UPI0008A000FA|nr:protein kinase [Paenibacillus sp. UNC499MF]SEG27239.1 serine/threonine protein kinase [Paenibacillus sp. UNC499MF]
MRMFKRFKHLHTYLHRCFGKSLRSIRGLPFRKGTVVAGTYKIAKKLGAGSFGVAYLALNTVNGQQVVLKRVSPVRGGKKRAEDIFAQETAMLRKLRHPDIPAFYEAFTWRGEFCFTMEYVRGSSLDVLLFREDRAFSEKEALRLVRRLLELAGMLHAQGIVHRDFSIANVLLDGDRVKLIDFGLARAVDSGGSASDSPHEKQLSRWDAEVDNDDPSEKKYRRAVHVTSDFYATGHLLLFLLYSTYSPEDENTAKDAGLSWEKELPLHPGTKKLLRRLLLTEQPYERADEIQNEIDGILAKLEG